MSLWRHHIPKSQRHLRLPILMKLDWLGKMKCHSISSKIISTKQCQPCNVQYPWDGIDIVEMSSCKNVLPDLTILAAWPRCPRKHCSSCFVAAFFLDHLRRSFLRWPSSRRCWDQWGTRWGSNHQRQQCSTHDQDGTIRKTPEPLLHTLNDCSELHTTWLATAHAASACNNLAYIRPSPVRVARNDLVEMHKYLNMLDWQLLGTIPNSFSTMLKNLPKG